MMALSLKTKKYVFAITYVAVTLIMTSNASAQINRGRVLETPFYDSTPAVCTTGTTLTGSDNAEKVWNFFMQKGLQPPQAAGIMGNLKAESGINPRRVQNTPTPSGDRDFPTNGVGFGLAQWTYTARQGPLVAMATEAGVVPGDLTVQLNFLMKELETDYKSTYNKILASNDVNRVSDLFMTEFERPADQSESKKESRRVFGREFLTLYGSNTGQTSSSGSNACLTGGNGEVIGGFSLPLDRTWYDRHKEWFTKPHHDYAAADIPVPTGTPVYSMTQGKVIKAPNGTTSGGFGLGVTIDAGNGVVFYYGHGIDGGAIPGVKVGDTVQPGQLIMHSGNTGRSSGPHLHLEIRIDNTKYCPQNLFVGIAEGTVPALSSLPRSGCSY